MHSFTKEGLYRLYREIQGLCLVGAVYKFYLNKMFGQYEGILKQTKDTVFIRKKYFGNDTSLKHFFFH